MVEELTESVINIDKDLFDEGFGFECGDGWETLLRLTVDAISQVAGLTGEDLRISQAKEKFGALRIYVDPRDPLVERIVQIAEIASFAICEECGKAGKVQRVSPYWVKTICDPCKVAWRKHRGYPLNEEE